MSKSFLSGFKVDGLDCPHCKENEWICIPDSLAIACVCGFVYVRKSENEYEPGPTMQEWIKDTCSSFGNSNVAGSGC
jgi:hypothetical protein